MRYYKIPYTDENGVFCCLHVKAATQLDAERKVLQDEWEDVIRFKE